MIIPAEHSIVITPFEDLDASTLRQVCGEISRIFHCRTEIMALLGDISFALDPGRQQYHSTSILEKLACHAPDHAIKVLAITDVDLFIPILTHVYGEAQLGGRTAILSTHRLQEGLSLLKNPETFRIRLAKEAIHELGHTFNLRHCRDPSCIMHYCRTVKDVDKKSDQFCRYCRILLADEAKRLET